MLNKRSGVSDVFSGRWAAILWLLVVIVVGMFLARALTHPGLVNTNVMDLLPPAQKSQVSEGLLDEFIHRNERRVVFALKGPVSAIKALYTELAATGDFASLSGSFSSEDQKAWLQASQEARLGTLNANALTRLSEPNRYARWVLSQLYSPVGGASITELQADPFLLLRLEKMTSQAPTNVGIHEDWLSAKDKAGHVWYLLMGELKPNHVQGLGALQFTERVNHAIETLRDRDGASIDVVYQGSVFYSAYAAQRAKEDITRLGGLSIIALIVLLWWGFRSWRPILLSALSIGVGALLGSAVTLAIFGQIHAITLVMCLSLMGIGVDYTLYYLGARMAAALDETPRMTLLRLRPSLTHALLSTALAYALMLWAPFPGLKQLAVFAVAGLIGAWASVVLWFPWLVKGLPNRPLPLKGLWSAWLGAWDRRSRGIGILLGVVLLGIVLGFARLHVSDDLKQWQSPAPILTHNETVIASLLGRDFSQTAYIVTGSSADEMLERLSHLREALEPLRREGVFRTQTSLELLSQAEQNQALATLEKAWPMLEARLRSVGVTGVTYRPPAMVDLSTWLASALGRDFKTLILASGQSGQWASLMLVGGVTNNARLAALAETLPGVQWVNRRATLETSFAHTRTMVLGLLALGWTLIGFGLMRRFGWRRGGFASLAVLISLLAGIAATGLAGIALNIFSGFALILVLGIGVDYSVFFASLEKTPLVTLFSMGMALGSSLLSLGILLFSQTAAVSNFGLVLTVGVLTAFLMAPMTRWAKPRLITSRDGGTTNL